MSRRPKFRLVAEPYHARPVPPTDLPDGFSRPAPELEAWARAVFIDASGPLHVEEHAHLESAVIGFLWASADNVKNGKRVLATAEIPRPPQTGGAWARARYWQQLAEWWPHLEGPPDFIVTVWTGCAELSNPRFLQVIHHELRHCGQAVDEYDFPRFSKETGRPLWAILGHDVERFGSEIRLFGVHDDEIRELLAAAKSAPMFGPDEVLGVCGTCK